MPGCAEGGEHDSQRVAPSNRIANGPGAPVRFTLQEGRRGCVSPAQLRVQESNLGGLESESRWDAGNPTRIVLTSPGSESNRRPPLYERGALYQLSYQGEMSVLDRFSCEPHPGIEPGISSLPRRCFTTEPAGQCNTTQCTTTWPPGDSNPDITVFTRALSQLS